MILITILKFMNKINIITIY